MNPIIQRPLMGAALAALLVDINAQPAYCWKAEPHHPLPSAVITSGSTGSDYGSINQKMPADAVLFPGKVTAEAPGYDFAVRAAHVLR